MSIEVTVRNRFLAAIAVLAASGALGSVASAQNALQGNGVPSAYIENTPGVLGGNIVAKFGSPTTPNGIAVVSISGSFAPFLFPFAELGPNPLAMNPLDPAYQVYFFGLDANGNGVTTVPTPPFFAGASPPLFLDTVTIESPSQWSVSRTSRLDWMAPDAWESVGAMGAQRQLHTATALGADARDNESDVLICGGAVGSFVIPIATASAELFSPVTRTTTPLPNMSLPRSGHGAVRLSNGLVLIAGGVTTGGVVTATCEFYDPRTRTFAPAPAMSTPRAAHAITLLDDGRVLVSGGVSDWQNTATNFIAALNTAQFTAEVFDPVASIWTSLPIMASRRLGHSQTKLLDGRVLIVSGINGGYTGALGGGQVPTYTNTCEIFDPATNSFTATSPLSHLETPPPFGTLQIYNGRAYHGASLLPNGNVLLTGGLAAQPTNIATNDESIPVPSCDMWIPATGTWQQVPSLPLAVAFQAQLPSGNGALITGGFTPPLSALTPSAQVVRHDGVTVTTLAPIGGGTGWRGGHSMTKLADGTFLVYGGGNWPNTLSDGFVYLAP